MFSIPDMVNKIVINLIRIVYLPGWELVAVLSFWGTMERRGFYHDDDFHVVACTKILKYVLALTGKNGKHKKPRL